ncbi:hypothetical protein PDIG_77130 [Penicillium digitatum PHI26]|uniref:Uncharacterized protein n=3 Tax=Penicillium digitatum TaxID=36651 RepID=K9FZT0_PEND2|nr:hypothetical protein PDIP_04250 [Penicillium digitatum Pd1]EKV06516.1 hypothetical protein PDIG_77130 [Penicillium digitatum PHI26]EKV21683.1 hypothetical protein PDIP_04250 [Penicillium digitatum Pd1]
MESTTHGAAQGAFEKIFEAWTGFDENYPLLATRNATFRGASGRNKRPDSAWQPLHAASGRSSHWPTIVLEVACSESRRKIERDIKFWLTESNDQVNIALTMRIYNRGRISVEEWRGRGPNRPPIPCQRIDIVRDAGLNGSRVQGSFRLSYEDIHLRERPQKATDFTLTAGNMEYIAKAVWEFQFA